MPHIALVTYSDAPDLTPDDELLRDALLRLGADPRAAAWDDVGVDWTSYDLVVLRSAWDYFVRPDEFASWITALDRLQVPLVNSPRTVRWNGDKHYLIELERQGIAIVPTLMIDAGDRSPRLAEILRARGWPEAVVKPAISGGAHDTWRTSTATAVRDEHAFAALRERAPSGVMVQPFVQEILRDGEWSLVFIDGAYSHAAVKRAQPGDFRVQHTHGGMYAPATPPDPVIADAGRCVAAGATLSGTTPRDLAYARVDGVITTDSGAERLLLMELECIEPSLFFLQAPHAAERMARSLLARCSAKNGDRT